MKTLSERLRFVMKLRGETQTSLAEKVHIAQNSISKIISGHSAGSVYLVKIAKVLKCDPFWLDDGKGTPPISPIPYGKVPFITLQQMLDVYHNKKIDFEPSSPLVDNIIIESDHLLYGLKINDDLIEETSRTVYKNTRTFSLHDILIIDISNKEIKPGDFVIAGEADWHSPLLMRYTTAKNKNHLISANYRSDSPIDFDKKIKIYAKVVLKIDPLSH